MLHIHRAERADALVQALTGLLADPLADPFAPEVVAVPTRGMERWLTQRMSGVLGARPGRADGVCANVVFPSPHRLVADAVATASGIDPAEDPWLPERAVWPLLDVVQESAAHPWMAPLAGYLGADHDPPDPVRQDRRLTALRHLSELFHRYALHRPSMLEAWAAGEDLDATGAPLPPQCAWQAELWRRLRARIAVEDLAHRWGAAAGRLAAEPGLLDLPRRVSLFGLTRIAAGQLVILRALAEGRDLHLFLLHPSPGLWERVSREIDVRSPGSRETGGRGAGSSGAGPVPRAQDPTVWLPANRLLASWGRDSREMQVVVARATASLADHHHGKPASPTAPTEATLLARVQDGLRADRPAPGAPLAGALDLRPGLAQDDRSIQVHSCHGRARQVEVVRDAILHALVADRTLEPRDVIVMCPDIETFAPLIQASFGAGDGGADDGGAATASTATPGTATPGAAVLPGADAPIDLRVRLADRSLRQTNPVLGVVAALLELAERRVTASEILDLADRGPVRRRFRLDDDDITRLQDWIAQSGIRWGLDAAHRAPYKLDALEHGTWRAGLQRLLVGVTMTEDEDRLFAGVLPLDDVDSASIDLAGRFTELVERAGDAIDALSVPQPLSGWARAIAAAADSLTATAPRDRWQRAELSRLLDEMTAEAGRRDAAQLAPAEMRAFLAERLAGRPTRANFRTGHLTVCTLVPMRSVPHRVVCLLGLDDGAFPRRAPRDGDDLMLDAPLMGERDPRSEDRQLLLDALMAAQEQLIITYTGNDERTNAARPAAVPVGELLDAVDATVQTSDGRPAREHVVIRHPLQPFDPRNFTRGAAAGTGPWSFDTVALAGAAALTGPRAAPPPFLRAPLPERSGNLVELADLVRFLEHPVRAFLRQRLGVSLWGGADEIEDGLSVELDGLQRWSVGQRLLDARLRGVEGRTAALAEIARGTLPPGRLGQPVIADLYPIVDAIVSQAQAIVSGGQATGSDPVDVRVALGGGRLLSGTVSGVSGDVLLTTTFSRVSAKHRLGAWARLLALSASQPDRPFAAATIGRAGGHDDVRTVRLPPLAADAGERARLASEHLRALVDLYDRGMREPLPLFCLTSAAYARAARDGQDPIAAAAREWETEWNFDREDRDLEHQLAFGGVLTFAEVLEIRPRDDEQGPGWDELEHSRAGRLARRLWGGLLECEENSAR